MTSTFEDMIANRISRVLADHIITGLVELGSELRQDAHTSLGIAMCRRFCERCDLLCEICSQAPSQKVVSMLKYYLELLAIA
ncbi:MULTISPECIES: hypothetical protein [unclassified Agrobacterium]|uniref:hypothetical protein n=1 Tax=unclassified Agrobacterium TaxID=2632611 RepID=UPI001FFDECB0|nr:MULTISPECIES: hypothetical protein [unclassified Agrobacterium]